jgi:hypothetical protein
MEQPALEPVPEPQAEPTPPASERPVEHGGRRSSVSRGLEPTRFGDWEKDGRCIDF